MSRPEPHRSERHPRIVFRLTAREKRKFMHRAVILSRHQALGWNISWWSSLTCWNPYTAAVKPSVRRPGRRAHRRSAR